MGEGIAMGGKQGRKKRNWLPLQLAAAMPLEYSVFLFVGSDEGCRRSVEDCLSLMNPNEDELRCYRLPAHGRRFEIGRTVLPDGVVWTGWSASESVG